MIEEMLSERGIVVSYETIRRWGRKFGPAYAKQLRVKKPSRKDIWHMDEVVISVGGRKHWPCFFNSLTELPPISTGQSA
jgi:putative transposase